MSAPQKGDLTDTEKELLQVIAAGNVQEASRLLGSKDVRVNCLDEYGMTPLMHAAYKGRADMCKLLLQHGADVNCNEHEHGYTALMFAGLSGKTDITWMMLDAGAETDAVNSVGRTAAQMAAFVGQHDCVTIVMLVKENPLLMDVEALEKCRKVLELICEKCIKQQDMNEVLAMKMHYLSCVLQKCGSFLKEQQDKLDGLIKSDGFPVFQEKFIRECIRKFPYCDATLLQQLVRSIAPVEIGSDPTALSVLTQAITGQVGFMDADFCTTCGEKGAKKRCSICKMVIYCDQACQKLHWFSHKKVCKMLQEQREKHEAESASRLQKQAKAESDQALEETTGTMEELSVSQSETTSSSDNQTQDVTSETVPLTTD
ncbi:hypothetical protein cypCar_00032060 [Cyprinus carpio]|nr:hypothetical protein cypCar_00032060 [Cyprinus carpio]